MSRRSLLCTLLIAALIVPAAAHAAEQRHTDERDDVIDPVTDMVTPFPRADITDYAVDATTAYLRLRLQLAQPTPPDPTVEPAWLGFTGPSLFVDVTGEDDVPEFEVAFLYSNERGRPAAIVYDVSGEQTPEVCEGQMSFDGTVYEAVVETSCIGSPSSFRYYASMTWDSDGDNEFDYLDFAPIQGQNTAAPTMPGPTRRVAGDSRIATAVAISQAQFPDDAASVYLARSDLFADAVAAGSLVDGPILLVPSCGDLPPEVRDEVTRLDPERVIALGGPTAVCDELLDEAGADRDTGRLSGDDRFATALAISQERYPAGAEPGTAYLARADEFADSVAGGALSDGPVLLVPSCGDVPEGVVDEVERLGIDSVVALGGEGAVCEDLLQRVADGAGGVTTDRVAGATRFDTAAAIARRAFSRSSTVHVANAGSLADAVAAGTLTDGPVMLVPACGPAPDITRATVAALGASEVVALGGTGAVCDLTLSHAATD